MGGEKKGGKEACMEMDESQTSHISRMKELVATTPVPSAGSLLLAGGQGASQRVPPSWSWCLRACIDLSSRGPASYRDCLPPLLPCAQSRNTL